MSFQIREATIDDIDALCSLTKELKGSSISYEDMNNRLQFVQMSPFDFLYVYEEEEAIFGLLGFRIRENLEDVTRYGEISIISVDSNIRRKGIGQVLMDYAEQLAKKHNCIGTWLVSGIKRVEAHPFYKKLGYEVNGYRFVKHF
ncbi:GNAT family N-acetyltransferase [Bacillus thuringiensis]|uniref:GNAT family N-acetyltransferase n=1 Tax=Bacillus thuringiensis serovar toumanoffi TaxID=180862 RepID=A0ABD5HZ36_BACTU|nr:GNAT family N-acetyltransferase [Bacillus thuringiensis]EEM96522.1 Acetyltransferase, GNAT [Bacillus thuringiensis IBL 200]MCR6780200.1 GNAT family N-acetyltransferase [Bacillus thuringiensis]MCR6858269.1 GNAT family N-acetyltransferase [Bacillus thuringiensis]MCR6866512.1 GNAT family N-acetyltransferase [Bacillus thuringiensis]MDW9210249.1 GNAT family N-acetyltransferase [Bacillus thuringiensis serovar toumanoffi]